MNWHKLFSPYRYEIWYFIDDEAEIFPESIKPKHICYDYQAALEFSKNMLQEEQYYNYETFNINKKSRLTGRTVGSFIYSKTKGKFISLGSYGSFYSHIESKCKFRIATTKDKLWLHLKIKELQLLPAWWKFKNAISTPLAFLTGLLILIYMMIVAPVETLLKAHSKEINTELTGFLNQHINLLFVISLIIYAFILFKLFT